MEILSFLMAVVLLVVILVVRLEIKQLFDAVGRDIHRIKENVDILSKNVISADTEKTLSNKKYHDDIVNCIKQTNDEVLKKLKEYATMECENKKGVEHDRKERSDVPRNRNNSFRQPTKATNTAVDSVDKKHIPKK